jgi:hypothetical protein
VKLRKDYVHVYLSPLRSLLAVSCARLQFVRGFRLRAASGVLAALHPKGSEAVFLAARIHAACSKRPKGLLSHRVLKSFRHPIGTSMTPMLYLNVLKHASDHTSEENLELGLFRASPCIGMYLSGCMSSDATPGRAHKSKIMWQR